MFSGGGGSSRDTAPPSQQQALLMSSIEVASKGWESFGWKDRVGQWESTTRQTKEAREASVAARKQLAETTKRFKRSVRTVETAGSTLSPDTIPSTVKSIDALSRDCRTTVKAYQEEIDNLTRRCKAAENAFAALAHALSDLPDPAAVLDAAVEQLHLQHGQIGALHKTVQEQSGRIEVLKDTVEKTASQAAVATAAGASNAGLAKQEKEELIQLRREVAEYEVEFRSLKNQDITIRKLEARIAQLQESGEAELEEKLEKAKQELVETEGRRAMEALEREAAMERKVHSLELQLKAEVAGRAAAQAHLLEADEGAGEREAAWEAQRKILVDDAETLRLRLHEATRERDELRLRVAATATPNDGTVSASSLRSGLASAPPSGGGIGMADLLNERKAYEAEVSELSHTANSLREELRLKDALLLEETAKLQKRIDELEHNESALNQNLASLETQLAQAPSQSLLDSMKRELRILKRLEYNAEDFDAGDHRGDPEMTGRDESDEQDLESVLVAKLRRIEADLVKERNQKSDLEKETENLKQRIADLQTKQSQSERLIESLEADLDRATATSAQNDKDGTTATDGGSAAEDPPMSVDDDGTILQSVLDPNAPPPKPRPGSSRQSSMGSTSTSRAGGRSNAEKAQDDHSVATIIMAQRDRLRARCDALEAERDSFKRELQAQVQAAESLKADNTKLFEKMRYLQSYSGNNPSSGGARGRMMAKDRDLDLEALEQRYEASVDPFRQFSRAERQRKLQEMSAMERTVFVVAKTFLASKEMRTFLFFYILAMHILVFLTTYHWSHNDTSSSCTMHNEMLSHLPPGVQDDHVAADAAASAALRGNH